MPKKLEPLNWVTVQRKVSDLIPVDFNPRTISEGDLQDLKESLAEFNLVDIPVVDFDDSIISGHQRIKALFILERGDEVIDVRMPNRKLEEKEFKKYMMLANSHAGKFDFQKVEDYFQEIDLSAISGFDSEEYEKFLDMKTPVFIPGEEDDFDETPPEIPETVLGDLYEIGEHRLLCGDSTDSDQVAKLMNGEKADMVFTDPPYNINYGNIKHIKFKQREIENDNMSGDDFKDFCRGFASKLFCDGIIYCWAGPGADGRIMFTVLDETFHCSTMIVWNKDQFTLGRGKYQNKHEVCWFGWNKNGSSFTENRTLTNVWD